MSRLDTSSSMNLISKDSEDLIYKYKYEMEHWENYKHVLKEFQYSSWFSYPHLSIAIHTYDNKPKYTYFLTNGRIESRDRNCWPDRVWNNNDYIGDDDLFEKIYDKYYFDKMKERDKHINVGIIEVVPKGDPRPNTEIIYLSYKNYDNIETRYIEIET